MGKDLDIMERSFCTSHSRWMVVTNDDKLGLLLLLVFNVTPFKIDQNKNQNCSKDKVQNPRKERRYICKDSRQDLGHSNLSYARYAEKRFTQIYSDLYGDAWAQKWRPETSRNICH